MRLDTAIRYLKKGKTLHGHCRITGIKRKHGYHWLSLWKGTSTIYLESHEKLELFAMNIEDYLASDWILRIEEE